MIVTRCGESLLTLWLERVTIMTSANRRRAAARRSWSSDEDGAFEQEVATR